MAISAIKVTIRLKILLVFTMGTSLFGCCEVYNVYSPEVSRKINNFGLHFISHVLAAATILQDVRLFSGISDSFEDHMSIKIENGVITEVAHKIDAKGARVL